MAEGDSSGGVKVCPPDHKHGLNNTCSKNHGCKCQPCRDGHAATMRRHRQRKKLGTKMFVSPLGTRRRLQALMAAGYSYARMGEHVGVSTRTPEWWMRSERTSVRIAHVVDLMYRELAYKKPPLETTADKVSYSRAIHHARRHGFHPPMAWDDIDRDEFPPAMSLAAARRVVDDVAVDMLLDGKLQPHELTLYERRAAVEAGLRRGWTQARVAAVTGLDPTRTAKRLRAEGA